MGCGFDGLSEDGLWRWNRNCCGTVRDWLWTKRGHAARMLMAESCISRQGERTSKRRMLCVGEQRVRPKPLPCSCRVSLCSLSPKGDSIHPLGPDARPRTNHTRTEHHLELARLLTRGRLRQLDRISATATGMPWIDYLTSKSDAGAQHVKIKMRWSRRSLRNNLMEDQNPQWQCLHRRAVRGGCQVWG